MIHFTDYNNLTINVKEKGESPRNLILIQCNTEILLKFKIQFNNLNQDLKNTIFCQDSTEDQFKLTPLFEINHVNFKKIAYVSNISETLRMISNALCTSTFKLSTTFITSNQGGDSKVSYFSENTKNNLLYVNYLGHQKHLNPNNSLDTFSSVSLGSLKNDISLAKPAIFDSSVIAFNINSIKYSDAPGQSGNNPSGLSSEEANQLAYLAGQSPKTKYLIFYGLEEIESDQQQITHNLIAQLLWYFNNGSQHPISLPNDITNKQEYTIESSVYSENLHFVKDLDTGNWFHKLPFELPAKYAEHQWIFSNHQEYLESSQEDIPYRIMEIYDSLKLTI